MVGAKDSLRTNGRGVNDAAGGEALERFAMQVREVSTLPQVALQVVDVVNNPLSSANELKMVLETDPALTVRVLRYVNSAHYGLRYEVTNVQQAIAMLGFNQIRNLAVTASVADIFRTHEETHNYSRRRLWKHLVAVAVAARMIASRSGIANFEEAFLGGLLHDLGIILEDQYAHNDFVELLRSTRPSDYLRDIEQSHFGFDHAQLGARVAEMWRFPSGVIEAIRYHHGTIQPGGGPSASHLPVAQAVEVANFLCVSKGIRSVDSLDVPKPERETLSALGIGRAEYRVLWEDLDLELAQCQNLIEI